jgi:hypothetical protein
LDQCRIVFSFKNSSAGKGHILLYNTLLLVKKNTQESEFRPGCLLSENREDQIARTLSSFALLELREEHSSLEWTMYGFVSFCILFDIMSKTDAGLERHACFFRYVMEKYIPFLSVMEEYTRCRKPGIYEIYVTYATY